MHATVHHCDALNTTVACQLAPDSSSSSSNNSNNDGSSCDKLSNAVIDAHLQGLHCIISDHPQLWTEPVTLTDGSVPGLSYISQASHSSRKKCKYIYSVDICEHLAAFIATGLGDTLVAALISYWYISQCM
jgi:hypothetical protein